MIKVKGNLITVSNGKETKYIELFEDGILRIYKKKNSAQLVYLNDLKKYDNCINNENNLLYGKYKIFVDENNLISIFSDKILIFQENNKLFNIKKQEDFSLALLEGHNIEEKETYKTFMSFEVPDDCYIYGLGDKLSQINKKHYEYVSYNTDDPSSHNETYKSLYKSINYMLINHTKNIYYGIFYGSSYKCVFNLCKDVSNTIYIKTDNGEYDYFVFLGNNPKQINKKYASLVGTCLLPKIKMFGYQQSRWSYKNEQEVRDVFNTFRKESLPIDYIHLDIDYMQKYKIFTIDKSRFPNLKKLSLELKEHGVNLVTILDPAVKIEEGYSLYELLIKNDGFAKYLGKNYVNDVWAGPSCFPNFFDEKVQTIFANNIIDFKNKYAIDGIWCDMNEPASFKGPLPEEVSFKVGNKEYLHNEVHNLYGEYMVKAVAKAFDELNERHNIITRACFATTSKYSIIWNGDNQSLWHHLSFSLPQISTLGLCNFPFDGVDIGGFGNQCNKELLIRWIEANIFSPFLRNHSSMNSLRQEPYAFDKETLDIYRNYLNIRYRFIPYLYDLAVKCLKNGGGIINPLFISYPSDIRVKEMNDEFLVGENILIAPILSQGTYQRAVYLPRGEWIDYFSSKLLKGNMSHLINLSLDKTGIFIKNNSIIVNYESLLHIEKENIDTLVIEIFGNKGKYVHYDDDGTSLDYKKGIFNKYLIDYDNGILTFKTVHKGFNSYYKKIKIIHHSKEIIRAFSYEFKQKI